MERYERNFIVNKVRNLWQLKNQLQEKINERDAIETSIKSPNTDGQPGSKGYVSDIVFTKVEKLAKINKRIETLQKEIEIIESFPETLTKDELKIYKKTIVKRVNLDCASTELFMGRRQLINKRKEIIKKLAEELNLR
jgi:hypothetical protein